MSQNPQNFKPMKIKKPYGTTVSVNSINYKNTSTVLTGLASLAGPWLANEIWIYREPQNN